ncbi:MAG TPA: SDR family oxidoreductase [Alphaproteobacteria bacterium]|nr:SDR family oxidoreductase [Alphaproteobacteria bacterium]
MATQRLGRDIALALARRGWDVAVHYNGSRAEAERTVADIRGLGRNAAALAADLGELDQLEGLVSDAAAALGAPISALVNSASIFEWDDIGTVSPETLMRHYAINAAAPTLLARHVLAGLPAEARGVIVNMVDCKLYGTNGDHLSYTLTKYALQGLTETLAVALAPRMRVCGVAPGYVLPAPGQDPRDFERLHAQTPLGRGTEAAEIAETVAFLVRNEAITGQTVVVDSGLRFARLERDISFL